MNRIAALVVLALGVSSVACSGVQAPRDRCAGASLTVGRLIGVASVVCVLANVPPEKCQRAQSAADLASGTLAGVCELIK